jgi:curved DNA-binding protein CbpA
MARQQGDSDGLYLRLEVLPGASHADITRAYRHLAHDAHPDAHPEDPDAPRRFREITEAYEVLGDPDRREQYDRARRQAGTGNRRPYPAPGPSSSAPGRTPVSAAPTATGGPLVFLGTRPLTGPPAQLSVGPVQFVGPSATGPPNSVSQENVAAALLARLLSEVFEPRWRS